MPYSAQTVGTSGIGPIANQSVVYVTYDEPLFPYRANKQGSKDIIPGFLYLGGSVAYEKDNQGNIIARNKSGGE